MSVTIGQVWNEYSFRYNNQRKIIRMSDGVLFVFVYAQVTDGGSNSIAYKKSEDAGQTWDASWSQLWVGTTHYSFDIYLNSDDSFSVLRSTSTTLTYTKFTYNNITKMLVARNV